MRLDARAHDAYWCQAENFYLGFLPKRYGVNPTVWCNGWEVLPVTEVAKFHGGAPDR
ncbi:hypothetical protein YSA_03503 [Pseudomonas putida ND6]|uniref:Uncharacterized protein n=1 Tax=Pseudomonas putida ND6 TaxID=231023 RepID=I3UT41_PSEPU|nr:hypothetical protein YSA_03503 [Pseudomonas putida ND6]